MSSFNGLKTIAATDIQNSGRFYLGNQVDPGTAGQALVSAGPDEPARWDTHTGTIQPLTIGTNLSLASGNPTFNGGTADTLNATDTNTQLNLTAALPVVINNGGGLNREVELQYDTNTLGAGGGALEVKKVPNDLTFTGYATGTYNGSSALNINLVDTDTTYTGGKNITVDTTPNPDEIDLDDDLTAIDSITFTSTAGTTALTGNNYPQNPTPMTNFDLTDTTNIVSPYFFHDVYDPASLDSDLLSSLIDFSISANLGMISLIELLTNRLASGTYNCSYPPTASLILA